ncbi:cobalamin-dependent protein [Clostridiales bacterium BAD-6]|uniref:Cobalamin-dependent protein n=2 Tax=Sinanaerobacter chloroacetimidivorans TaxID=2818044 RepID=A0A8J8B1K6_9FIRM|nr:cobalamin-dependent protein [Sinanaerobacter chloroacetimidivorans]
MDADEEKAVQVIEDALEEGLDLIEILQEGFAEGNREVGELFENGQLSLPELIFSTEVMKKVIDLVEAHTGMGKEKVKGKVLIATVDGDVHEIGKGMVASTMKSYGIEVIDIGREVPVETIIEKAEEYGVDIIGTSALLTSTLKEQKKLEDALREMGLRNKYKTMVGGAPCTLRWAKRIGADAYSEDAVEAAKKALELLKK